MAASLDEPEIAGLCQRGFAIATWLLSRGRHRDGADRAGWAP